MGSMLIIVQLRSKYLGRMCTTDQCCRHSCNFEWEIVHLLKKGTAWVWNCLKWTNYEDHHCNFHNWRDAQVLIVHSEDFSYSKWSHKVLSIVEPIEWCSTTCLLVSILDYQPSHMPHKCSHPVKKSVHIGHIYIRAVQFDELEHHMWEVICHFIGFGWRLWGW